MESRKRSKNRRKEFEKALDGLDRIRYVLKLYVTGSTPRSTQAISNLNRICEEHLKGFYDLEVIDIYQQPILAKGEQIIATPTLVKKLPSPVRRLVGDLSRTEKVLLGLDIREKKPSRIRPAGKGVPEKG